MFKWIDSIPLPILIGAALLLGGLPLHSTPHLVEKLMMLMQGELVKPLDIFDLFMHGAPSVLLIVRVLRLVTKK